MLQAGISPGSTEPQAEAGAARWELKSGTKVAPMAKVPLFTPCSLCDKVTHKTILPEKVRVRKTLMESDLKIKWVESVHYFTGTVSSPNFLPFQKFLEVDKLGFLLPNTGLRQVNRQVHTGHLGHKPLPLLHEVKGPDQGKSGFAHGWLFQPPA